MGFEGEVWRLMGQEELLGEIVIDEADFPWLNGRFVPTPTFIVEADRLDTHRHGCRVRHSPPPCAVGTAHRMSPERHTPYGREGIQRPADCVALGALLFALRAVIPRATDPELVQEPFNGFFPGRPENLVVSDRWQFRGGRTYVQGLPCRSIGRG
ncbi:hypothetical protein OG730_40815 [Streptomyces sp. NBC_01298]|uniref:hypothetical protein n=1 Tax=Streptomyces sp. NBC_01298 TaxID=2903817 RepID=UPI002E135EAE|nr:hypothetical protein OG730_40815 [Streptomyces sp. NBC_01298]